jgi:hypothetical protein
VTVTSTPGVITNTASVTSATDDPDLANNTTTEDTTVRTTLTVSIMPDAGNGSVTATGINCGAGNTDCTEAYSTATSVNLTATPAAGWRFLRWEGALTGSTNPDTVSMSTDRSVTALFATDRGVCDDPLLCFTTIQAAIDAAVPGDIIKLTRDTTYSEGLSISTAKELTISGGWDSGFTSQAQDPSLTVINGDTDGDTVGNGPVLSITAVSSLTVENLTLANGNSASGGGIKIEPADGPVTLKLVNAALRDNVAGDGAGVFMSSTTSEAFITLNVVNTIIAASWTAGRGGGIAAFASNDGTVTVNLINSTITDNRAVGAGAGLSIMTMDTASAGASITNSIIWGNLLTDLTEDGIRTSGASISVIASYSNIPTEPYASVPTNISADPVFLNPALLDYRLNNDSPAINAGDNASASALAADIMGQPRVANGTVDMGAHEYQPAVPTAIRLLSLNGGEVIDAGMLYDITWEAPASAQSFKVFYSLDNGLTWLKAKSADPAVTGNIVTGQRHFRWDVPIQTKNNKKCKIKVIGYTGTNATGTKAGIDISDLPFMLQVIRIIDPDGEIPGVPAQSLKMGSPEVIRWVTTEKPQAAVASIRLSYTADGGVTYKAIPGGIVNSNDGVFTWTVPAFSKTKKQCKVKVELFSGPDASGTKVGTDTSDYFFVIAP